LFVKLVTYQKLYRDAGSAKYKELQETSPASPACPDRFSIPANLLFNGFQGLITQG